MTDKTFEEMMRELGQSHEPADQNAAPTSAELARLSDAVLAVLEAEPMSLWAKQCVLGTALMRIFTGEPDLDRRQRMIGVSAAQFADKGFTLMTLAEHGIPGPDLSYVGAIQAEPSSDVGHA